MQRAIYVYYSDMMQCGRNIHIALHMKVVVDVVSQLCESIPTHTIRRSATNTCQASGECGSARLVVCRPKCTHVTHNTARIASHFTLVRVWLLSIVVGVHATGSVGCLCSSFIVLLLLLVFYDHRERAATSLKHTQMCCRVYWCLGQKFDSTLKCRYKEIFGVCATVINQKIFDCGDDKLEFSSNNTSTISQFKIGENQKKEEKKIEEFHAKRNAQ